MPIILLWPIPTVIVIGAASDKRCTCITNRPGALTT
jgi:hypothetical protein